MDGRRMTKPGGRMPNPAERGMEGETRIRQCDARVRRGGSDRA